MSSFMSTESFKFHIGSKTDIGGQRENQDELYEYANPERNIRVMAVFDGHGKPTGKMVAIACREYMKSMVENVNNQNRMEQDPIGFMTDCFEGAHIHVQEVLIAEYKSKGYEIMVNGAILKQWPGSNCWENVTGGATQSMVLIVKDKMYIANVGDSDVVMCSSRPILKNEIIHYEVDTNGLLKEEKDEEDEDATLQSYTLKLTCDHSPENECEYKRMRKQAPSVTKPNEAKMLFVYDDNAVNLKFNCKQIFDVSQDGVLTKCPSRVTYYKNIRKESSTYIVSPTENHSLAFTRSIGDFALCECGLTCKPEIQSVDLNQVFNEDASTVCVIVASDGVWDNWEYDKVGEFVMYPNCLEQLTKVPETGAQNVTNSFMARNDYYAKQHFGGSGDNATAVLMYITKV
jgi:serine/threonine protein phosphatase PrpC